MTIPAVTEIAEASAMPMYPILGKGKMPKTRTKFPMTFKAPTMNMVTRGFFTSPLARNIALEMMRI